MEQKDISADDFVLFASIAEQGSMARTAAQLNIPKATVSRRLANLEAALGQRLLIRTTRRVVITDFGLEFLEHCRRVTEEFSSTLDFVRSRETLPHGHLRVSMPADYAQQRLTRAIATFSDAHPQIQLDVDLSSRRVDIIGERYDLAIRMGTLEDDATLVARKIDEQSFGLYASPIYLALHPAPEHPDDLQRHRAVRMLSANGAAMPWKLVRGKEVWEGTPPGRLSVSTPDMVQQLLLDGAGVGALPDSFAAADVALGRLQRVLPEWSLPPVPAWAVMPMRRYLPARTRAFLEHIERFMGKDAPVSGR